MVGTDDDRRSVAPLVGTRPLHTQPQKSLQTDAASACRSVDLVVLVVVDREDVSEATLVIEPFRACLRRCATGCDGQGSEGVGVVNGEDDGVEAGDSSAEAAVVSSVTRRRTDEICWQSAG
jgi:hypothetical protein